MIVVTVACDCCAIIFLVRLAILRRLIYSVSQYASRAVPSVMANSAYNEQVLAATVVRKLTS